MRHCVPTLFLDNNFSASAQSKDNSLCRSWPYPILQGELSSQACTDCWTSNKTRFIVTNQPLGDLPLGMRVEASVRQEVEAKATCFEQLQTATTRASVGHALPRFVRRRFSRDCFANRCKCRACWWLSERKLLERWLRLRVWKRCYWTFFTTLLSERINLASWRLRFLKGFLWKRFGVEFGKFRDERFLCDYFVRIATLENRQIA